jgi:hypothetical protein
MKRDVTIGKSIRMAIRHPGQSHILLAKTLAQAMNGEKWIDRNMKKQFCLMLLNNYLDHAIEREADEKLLRRVKNIPLLQGIRFLKRAPEEGLKVLVSLVSNELQNGQKLSQEEQMLFYREILNNLFPEVSLN